jgi:hypothetical protein
MIRIRKINLMLHRINFMTGINHLIYKTLKEIKI